MIDPPALFSVILAAGSARRFGSTKQLACFAGRPLVAHALSAAETACGADSVIVLGSDWQRVLTACHDMRGFILLNEAFASGMASSIRLAVLTLTPIARAVLLLLADQPLVDATHLHNLKETAANNPEKIVASAYAGVNGPPIIFPHRFFAELTRLTGDQGARSVLTRNPLAVITVACPAAAADIDRPEDLEKLSACVRQADK